MSISTSRTKERNGTFGTMRDRAAWTFISVAGLLSLPPLVAVLGTGQLDLHSAINRFNAPWADPLFAYGTHLADGWVAVAIGLALLFVRWRWFLLFAASTVGSSLVAQFLKHVFFEDHDRPSTFTSGMPDLRLVPGVDMLHHNSFPSGHSTCAFSMCFALALIIGQRAPAVAFAVLAALLAFSRVYLSQHFTEDVLCGAFIGTATGCMAYVWTCKSDFSKKPWLNAALLRPQNQ